MIESKDLSSTVLAHRPLGFEAPYTAGPDERTPRRPSEKQPVKLGVTTPLLNAPEVVRCHWRLNGLEQGPFKLHPSGLAPQQASPFLAVSPLNETASGGSEQANNQGESVEAEEQRLCWEASFGPFNFGDRVEYGFSSHSGHEEESERSEESYKDYPYGFSVSGWRRLVLAHSVTADAGQAPPELLLCRELSGAQLESLATLSVEKAGPASARLQLTRHAESERKIFENGALKRETELKIAADEGIFTLAQSSNLQTQLTINKPDGTTVLASGKPFLEGLLYADGTVQAVRLNFSERPGDFYGLGERFNHLNQRGLSPDIQVYEEYKNQGARTYFPIPFGFSPEGYGLFLDTSAYARFYLPEIGASCCEVEWPGRDLSLFFFCGEPVRVLQAFTGLTGRPELPPDWIYTPWMSGNEWNSQATVMERVNKSAELNIPAGVVVIEAWADETTFYAWNDAEYAPRDPATPPRLADFAFPVDGHWPDPKGMIDELHERGIKVILWQIPVLKSFEDIERSMAERSEAGQKPQLAGLEQHRLDVAYALEKGFVVMNADGAPYRNPGIWFNGAFVLDVTNPAARQWWMERRAYLVQEMGVDGFKTDGGEHLWGRDLRFTDGRTGAELINAYPALYSRMYYDALQQWRGTGEDRGITFSRAGFSGSQLAPCHWAGDENSTFAAFRHSIVAGLSAGLSGIPFWGWDIGGFSGPLPGAELYLRGAGMALFCPIMQYHSEYYAHRRPLRDRTPWNIAEQNGAPWLVEAYARLAQLRLELVPYLAQAGRESARTGEPMMRALVLDWPQDPECRYIEDQYMLGKRYLVAPVVEEGAESRNVYLPEGRWRDWWETRASSDAPVFEGGCWLKNYPAPLLDKPVLVFEKL
ncbi:MAG TPA: TIM-barrel domain-containing protein [Chloroflexia bacterium]|nr:TIM-barrel domain-containing protein [Chloroflexia bacterium]